MAQPLLFECADWMFKVIGLDGKRFETVLVTPLGVAIPGF